MSSLMFNCLHVHGTPQFHDRRPQFFGFFFGVGVLAGQVTRLMEFGNLPLFKKRLLSLQVSEITEPDAIIKHVSDK